jgi:hypothetical protein
MAWRIARGLFRIWLVLSVIWIVAVGTVAWNYLPSATKAADVATAPPFDPSKPYVVVPDGLPDDWFCETGKKPGPSGCPPTSVSERWQFVQAAAEIAFLPPALALLIGAALSWAFRGFWT